MEIKLAGLGLANVSDGQLEARFQELLCEATEINEAAFDYVGNARDERVCRIVLEVEIRHRPAIGGDVASTTIVSGAEMKRPKRVKSAQPAYVRAGAFMVEDKPAEQLEAFNTSVGRGGILRPLTDRTEGASGGK